MRVYFSLREEDPDEMAIIEWINGLSSNGDGIYRCRAVGIGIVAALKDHISITEKKERVTPRRHKDNSTKTSRQKPIQIKEKTPVKSTGDTKKTKEYTKEDVAVSNNANTRQDDKAPVSNRLSSIMRNVKFD